MVDLASLKPSERIIEITHPSTGENIGIRISVVSLDDDRLKKVKRAITDRRLHLEARGKTFKVEEIERNQNELLFAAMTGWEWYKIEGADEPTMFKGKVPDFNQKNVFEILSELPWFETQVNEAVGDVKSFFAD